MTTPVTIRNLLLKTLQSVNRPSAFCVATPMTPVLPGLVVDGIGPIGLPLGDDQAAQLIDLCHQAPYGKGEQTLVDTDVRRVRALDPDRFTLARSKKRIKAPEHQSQIDRVADLLKRWAAVYTRLRKDVRFVPAPMPGV